MALLDYCVYGIEEDFIEQRTVLNKILCGKLPHEMLIIENKLTKNQKLQAEEMLVAAIKNWNVLKSTSPDGLRDGFLQREGVLKKSGADWELHVERKTIDILLEKLPYPLSIIKLPWMKNKLWYHGR